MNFKYIGFLSLAIVALPKTALAYLGPGMATGFVVLILGIFAAFILLIVSMIYLPLKQKRKKKNEPPE